MIKESLYLMLIYILKLFIINNLNIFNLENKTNTIKKKCKRKSEWEKMLYNNQK